MSLATAAVGVLGIGAAANAEPVPSAWADRGTAITAAAPTARALGATFDRPLTQAMYAAAVVSASALRDTCDIAPPLVRGACRYVAQYVWADFVRLGPPNGRCLKSSAQIGWPPVRLSYVNC
ncbi:hypothetical protein [Amycolatopsis sp. NPDC003731]